MNDFEELITTNSAETNPFDLIFRFFKEPIFVQALTHASYVAEHLGTESYERLEFFGDSILGYVVSEHLFQRYSRKPEGELAKIKSQVVATKNLGVLAERYGVGIHILLGTGEIAQNGRNKLSTLGDVVEALIAATYISKGIELTKTFIMNLLQESIELAAVSPGSQNFKSQLQESLAALKLPLPSYVSYTTGQDHEKTYYVTVYVGDKVYGYGEGSNKKTAEQLAAQQAYEKLILINTAIDLSAAGKTEDHEVK